MTVFFLVNSVEELIPSMTTARLIMAAQALGLETWVTELKGLGVDLDGAPRWQARQASQDLSALKSTPPSPVHPKQTSTIFVRLNPARFGTPEQLEFALWMLCTLESQGYRVLNSPLALLKTANKAFLSLIPEELRPRQAVVTNLQEMLEFLKLLGGRGVLKPTRGTRGENVLFLSLAEQESWNSTAQALLERGPLVLQERLESEVISDTRVLLLNGAPFEMAGQPLAVRRVAKAGELRSNIHQGGRAELATLDEELSATVQQLGPIIRDAGLTLVGLDLMNGKVLELNVWAPGGLGPFEELTGLDARRPLLQAMLAGVESP